MVGGICTSAAAASDSEQPAGHAGGSSHNGRSCSAVGWLGWAICWALIGCDLPPRLDWPGNHWEPWVQSPTASSPLPATISADAAPARPPTPPPPLRHVRIDRGGRPVGAASYRTLSPTDDHRQRSYAYVGLHQRGAATITGRVTCDATFDNAGSLRSLDFLYQNGLVFQRCSGQATGTRLSMQSDAFGERRAATVPIAPTGNSITAALWLPPGQIMSAPRLGDWLAGGDAGAFRIGQIFSPDSVRWLPIEIRDLGPTPVAELQVNSVDSPVDFETVLTVDETVHRSVVTIDPQAMPLRTVELASRLSERWVTTPSDQAFFDSQGDSARRNASATLPLGGKPLAPAPLSRLGWSIRWTGPADFPDPTAGPFWPPPSTDLQLVEKFTPPPAESPRSLRVLVVDQPTANPKVLAGFRGGMAAPTQADLAASEWIDFASAAFVRLSPPADSTTRSVGEEAFGDDAESFARWRAEQSAETVTSLLTFDPAAGQGRRASDLLVGGQADRLEHATLLAALLRRQKIPARIALGLRPTTTPDHPPADQKNLVAAAWVMFWDGKQWWPLDATDPLPDGFSAPAAKFPANRLTLWVDAFAGADVGAVMRRFNETLGLIQIEVFGSQTR